MKVKVMLNEAVIVSGVKYEHIRKIMKFRPEILTLYDDNGEAIFEYGAYEPGETGGLIPYCLYYDRITDDGYAALNIEVKGETAEEKVDFIAENFGHALKCAKEIEEKIPNELARINDEMAAVKENIEVVL